jgi:hypothetical protein
MKHRLFTLAAALSLVLCIATGVQWTLEGDRHLILRDGGDGIGGGSSNASYVLFAERGNVGFAWRYSHWHSIFLPAWLVVFVAAILPACWYAHWVSRRGKPVGYCPACGYDLRATPDRCPECGKVPTKAPAA